MSDVNPYAAPQSAMQASGPSAQDGEPQPWEIGEVLSTSWEVFKRHWILVLVGLVVLYVIVLGAQLIATVVATGVFGQPVRGGQIDWRVYGMTLGLQMTVAFAAQAVAIVGYNRLLLQAVRGEQVRFETMFGAFGQVPAALGAMLLALPLVYLGFALLIVPGVIISLGTSMYVFAVADGDGAVDSLKNSWAWTRGQKAQVFLFLLVFAGINFAGALACGVGMLVSIPVTMLAWAVVYTRVSGRTAPRQWGAA